ncbi:MAG: TonB-dependent receptor plug domain-containing protein, partial [Acidobacteriota bacterium]
MALGLVFMPTRLAAEGAANPSPEVTARGEEPAKEEVNVASQGTGRGNDALEWIEDAMFNEIPTVISASRYEQGINEAPASISIVTADEIRMFGYQSLNDILEYTRGLYVSDDRNYRYAGVRGFSAPSDYNNRILVMINGHTTNEKWTGGSYIGNDFGLDLDLVDRIEIVRGPASALYGSNAVFAVINVITREPEDMAGLNMKIGAGSFQTGMAGLYYGRSFTGGNGFVVGGTGTSSDGQDLFFPEFNSPSTNLGMAEGADAEFYGNLFGSLKLDNWTFEGKVNRRKK